MMNEEIESNGLSAGIVRELGDLPDEAVITEQGLAKIFGRHRVSIKRAIERRELPPSIRLFGQEVWTVRALREHMAKRLDAAMKESELLQGKINKYSA